MLHVATVSSLLVQLNAPSPSVVIVLVAFVPNVNVPLVGDKLIVVVFLFIVKSPALLIL